MKLSVSLPDGDVSFIDSYASAHGSRSRSSVIQEALAALRDRELGAQYQDAWDEWSADGDSALWDTTAADGLGPTSDATADATR